MKAIIKRIISPLLQKTSAGYLKKRRKYSYRGISVWVEPTVFPPFLTISTKLLLQFIETLALNGKKLLELGCGCGVISILAAKDGATVTAVDINETALEALRKNALENRVSVDIQFSDLFGNLAGKTFDYIIINPPYYPKAPQSIAEKAWFCGENFDYFESLFAQLPEFLGNSETYMILSEDCDVAKIKAIAYKNGMAFELIQEKKVAAETNYIFQIVSL
jgi:release factor glutamine methyltransferase